MRLRTQSKVNQRVYVRHRTVHQATYNLYADASRTRVLGDGTGASVTLQLNANRNHPHTQSIWGRILGGQKMVMANSYADIVVVTWSY